MKSKLSVFIVSFIGFCLSAALMAQSPVDAIRVKLAEKLPNGTQIILHRDGLWMYGQENAKPLSNVYKNGAISQAFGDALQIKTTLPAYRDNPPPGLPHLRKFGGDDRLWVSSTTVRGDSVELTLNSDTIRYVRYIATLKFVFPDKKLPPLVSFMGILAEVMDAVPRPAVPATVATAPRPASDPAESMHAIQPVAPTPVSIPKPEVQIVHPSMSINPATLEVLGVHLGMTSAEVNSIFAQRAGKAVVRSKLFAMDCKSNFCNIWADDQFTPEKTHSVSTYLDTDQFHVVVWYTELYPYDPARPEVATKIIYSAKLKSDADRDAFVQRVVQKYGPSVLQTRYAQYWCDYKDLQNTEPIQRCIAPYVVLGNGQFGDTGISVWGDETGLIEREKALWESQRHSTLPPI